MILLGLVILAAAVVFGVDLALTNNHPLTSDVTVFSQSLGVHTDWVLFVVGAVAGGAAMLGLALMAGGGGRGLRRRRGVRRETELAAVVAERDHLRNELERSRRAPERVETERVVEPAGTARVVEPAATVEPSRVGAGRLERADSAEAGDVDLRDRHVGAGDLGGREAAAGDPALAGTPSRGLHARGDERQV